MHLDSRVCLICHCQYTAGFQIFCYGFELSVVTEQTRLFRSKVYGKYDFDYRFENCCSTQQIIDALMMFKLTQVPYLHCWQCVWKTKCVAHGTVNAKRTIMTSSNGNIFRITIPFWGESIGHRWIPLIKASDTELCCFLWSLPEQTNISANNRDAGNLRRHRAHYDITVMAVKTVHCMGLGELLNKKCVCYNDVPWASAQITNNSTACSTACLRKWLTLCVGNPPVDHWILLTKGQ